MTLRTSPLDAAHRSLGAKMVPFGGWDMPLSYEAGTLAEHRACRTSAVCFDVSHLGTVHVSGPGARATLQHALSNDLDKIGPGRCQYTHLLNEAGGVTDDIIVWWRSADAFDVMPNASNTDSVLDALSGDGATARDVTPARAVIAVQGPTSRSMTSVILPEASNVERNHIVEFDFDGTPCVAAGTGYTGEDGFEVSVPADRSADLWRAITSAGVEPAGLGARDTLRLEAGLPLHGHELHADVTPLNANLAWVVGWNKPDFVGRESLEAQKAAGVSPVLIGLRTDSRRPPRDGQAVLLDGQRVGSVSSGNFSPMLEVGIALAYVRDPLEVGCLAAIETRSGPVSATVVPLPFVGA